MQSIGALKNAVLVPMRNAVVRAWRCVADAVVRGSSAAQSELASVADHALVYYDLQACPAEDMVKVWDTLLKNTHIYLELSLI